ncbi:MAG TPA: D-alanine--D-alanine ligase family protein [Gemmatimonadota bacterium]|nr:D-alanine--D-alanine ligase family protein [Gemmatimonadota bacterium]
MAEGQRLRVGLLFGGRSSEHEVSLMSARSVLEALDPGKYEVVQIGITKEGRWLVAGDAVTRLIEQAGTGGALEGEVEDTAPVALLGDPSRGGRLLPVERTGPPALEHPLGVVFPLVHGRTGEDGALQGLFELAGVPYVGAGILGSALGMDKATAKRLWVAAGLPCVEHLVMTARRWREDPTAVQGEVAGGIGFPCFVKPANSGSSIGVHKVHALEELAAAMDDAARYDVKLLVEKAIEGRELECGVLGNDEPAASVVGEVVPGHEFYDYEDKYFDDAVRLVIPADLPEATAEEIRDLAVRAFQAVEADGMARVDFFFEGSSGRVLLNEINTIPGFTRMSMYPRLWEASGVPFPRLCDRLIELALERARERGKLRPIR